jgi:hypothetical protein
MSRYPRRDEVECRRCGEDCYWEDGVLYSLDTEERHVCPDEDASDDFEELE